MGSILYMTINQLFSEYVINNKIDMEKTNIIVVSRDIEADLRRQVGSTREYESRYKNVDFAQSLRPSPKVEEVRTCGTSIQMYVDEYVRQLNSRSAAQKDICAIVDLVIHDDFDVIIVCSNVEMLTEYLFILRDYMKDYFHIQGYFLDEITEGVDIHNVGDKEDIEKVLELQIQNAGVYDKVLGEFFNRFTHDMEVQYRRALESKPVDELLRIGVEHGLHISKHKPKNYIIDHILAKILSRDSL